LFTLGVVFRVVAKRFLGYFFGKDKEIQFKLPTPKLITLQKLENN